MKIVTPDDSSYWHSLPEATKLLMETFGGYDQVSILKNLTDLGAAISVADEGVVSGVVVYGQEGCYLTAKVYWIAVAPHSQGLGIGRMLMQHVVNWSVENDMWSIRVECHAKNHRVCRFYRRAGFKRLCTVDNHYGMGYPMATYVRYLELEHEAAAAKKELAHEAAAAKKELV